ncbi:hypothetical protein OG948_39455 (plasmid) [Embleya sp. NBC_00888]|nr:hypothetical protein OG948_39455 [Embleya sp. NBC_00888]
MAVEQVQRGGHRGGGGVRVGGGLPGVVEQPWHIAYVAGQVRADVRRLRRPPGSFGPCRARLGGTHQRRNRVRPVAAPRTDLGGLLEQRHELFVGFHRGLRQVPDPLLGNADPGLRECAVHAAPLIVGRQVHHRGAHQRVPEFEPAGRLVHVDQPDTLRRGEVLHATSPGDRPAHDHQVAAAFQGRHEQEVPRGGGQGGDPGGERGLEALCERNALRQGLPGGPLGIGERGGELQQREGIAFGVGHQSTSDPRNQRREATAEQLLRRGLAERTQFVQWKPAVVEEALVADPDRTDGPGPGAAVRQSTRHLPQHDGTGPVQPMRVVQHQQGGPIPEQVGDQGDHGLGDRVVSGSRPTLEIQGRGEDGNARCRRPALGCGHQQLPQRAVTGLRPVLHTHGGRHPHPGGLGFAGDSVVQRRLSHSRFAEEHQRSTGARDVREEERRAAPGRPRLRPTTTGIAASRTRWPSRGRTTALRPGARSPGRTGGDGSSGTMSPELRHSTEAGNRPYS